MSLSEARFSFGFKGISPDISRREAVNRKYGENRPNANIVRRCTLKAQKGSIYYGKNCHL